MRPPACASADVLPSTSGRGVVAAAGGAGQRAAPRRRPPRPPARPPTTPITPAITPPGPAAAALAAPDQEKAGRPAPLPSLLPSSTPAIPPLTGLPPSALPRHLAIILDGNRRWARARGLPDRAGHAAGVEALRTAVAACGAWGIPALTVFGFSTENYRRGGAAAAAVLGVARAAATSHAPALAESGVRLRFIPPGLTRPRRLVAALRAAEALTDSALAGRPPSLHLTVALSYGGRADIASAAASLAADAAAGRVDPAAIDAAAVAARLSSAAVLPADLASPDLIVRTAGERRLSNFLLFEAAYAELAFSDVLWPDFGVGDLAEVLREYAGRPRRFGE